MAIQFILLVSRQGKCRLAKWFQPIGQKEKHKTIRDVTSAVLNRPPKMCNFLEWREQKLVFKRYASLFFIAGTDANDNELYTLETIHLFVEILDRYFGNVCELDLIFNFHKAYYILDELLIGGELQETSKQTIFRVVSEQDAMMEEDKKQGGLGRKLLSSK